MKVAIEISEYDIDCLGKALTKQIVLELRPLLLQQKQVTTYNVRDRGNLPEQKYFRMKDLLVRTGLSRSTIYSQIADGRFPKPIKLGKRCSAWRAEDLEAWEFSAEHGVLSNVQP